MAPRRRSGSIPRRFVSIHPHRSESSCNDSITAVGCDRKLTAYSAEALNEYASCNDAVSIVVIDAGGDHVMKGLRMLEKPYKSMMLAGMLAAAIAGNSSFAQTQWYRVPPACCSCSSVTGGTTGTTTGTTTSPGYGWGGNGFGPMAFFMMLAGFGFGGQCD
jgi:hypothetical protein